MYASASQDQKRVLDPVELKVFVGHGCGGLGSKLLVLVVEHGALLTDEPSLQPIIC